MFIALFASANPLIGQAFSHVVLPDAWATTWRTLFGLGVFMTIWTSLRTSARTTRPSRFGEGLIGPVFEPSVATLILSLVTFNAIFAVENVLDIVFLWSGAPLPAGVTGIRGAVELLQDHPDMAPEDRCRFLANADADARRLALLVTRLLDLARADMAEPDEQRNDAAQVITRVADSWRTGEFSVDIVCPAETAGVDVPATTLEAVLATLLENSRQAGARSVTIRLGADNGHVEVLVSDDGPGVPLADRARLFEPFFTTKRETGGSGLGLAISRSLMEAQRGSLAILDSATTTFVIRIPVER